MAHVVAVNDVEKGFGNVNLHDAASEKSHEKKHSQDYAAPLEDGAVAGESFEIGNTWNAKLQRLAGKFNVEQRGIERVPEDERTDKGFRALLNVSTMVCDHRQLSDMHMMLCLDLSASRSLETHADFINSGCQPTWLFHRLPLEFSPMAFGAWASPMPCLRSSSSTCSASHPSAFSPASDLRLACDRWSFRDFGSAGGA
jgi:hypothetical protein